MYRIPLASTLPLLLVPQCNASEQNGIFLSRLPGPPVIFPARDCFSPRALHRGARHASADGDSDADSDSDSHSHSALRELNRGCQAVPRLELKLGAQVLLCRVGGLRGESHWGGRGEGGGEGGG